MTPVGQHKRSRWPKVGQIYEEVGSAIVNGRTREVLFVGSDRLLYQDELGRKHAVKIKTFIRWARQFTEYGV